LDFLEEIKKTKKEDEVKVLILEDSYYRVGQFRERLKQYGIEDIMHANNAKDCIKLLKKKKYDVIFLDFHLDCNDFVVQNPDNTGGKVAEWISKNYHKQKDANIIVHSGSEFGAGEIKKFLPNAHIIYNAWKKEMFDQVTTILGLNKI
jgi:CheY-like chemotaxis protein